MSPASNTTDFDEIDEKTETGFYSSPSRQGRIQKRYEEIDSTNDINNDASVQLLPVEKKSSKHANPKQRNAHKIQDVAAPLLSTADVDQNITGGNTFLNKERKKRNETVNSLDNDESQKLFSQSTNNKEMQKYSSHSLKDPNKNSKKSSHSTRDDLRNLSLHSNKDKDMQKSSSHRIKNQNKINNSSHSKTDDTIKSRTSSSMSIKPTRDSSTIRSSDREGTNSSSRRRDKSWEARKERDEHRSGGTLVQRTKARTPGRSPSNQRRKLGEDRIVSRSPEIGTKRSTEVKQKSRQESALRSPAKRSKEPTVVSSTEQEVQKHSLSDEREPRTAEKCKKMGDDESRYNRSPKSIREKWPDNASDMMDRTKANDPKTPKQPSNVQPQRGPFLSPQHNHIKGDDMPRCPKRSPTLSPKKSPQRGRLPERTYRPSSEERSQSVLRKPSMQDLSFPLTPVKRTMQPSTEINGTSVNDSWSDEADKAMIQCNPSQQSKSSCSKSGAAKALKSGANKTRRKESIKTSKTVSTKNNKQNPVCISDENEFSDFSDATMSERQKETNVTAFESDVEQTPRRKELKERLDFSRYFRSSAKRKSKPQFSHTDEGYDTDASSCSSASSVSKRTMFGLTMSHHFLLGSDYSDNDTPY